MNPDNKPNHIEAANLSGLFLEFEAAAKAGAFFMQAAILRRSPELVAAAMKQLDRLHELCSQADIEAMAMMHEEAWLEAHPEHRGVGEGDAGLPDPTDAAPDGLVAVLPEPPAECDREKPMPCSGLRLEIVGSDLEALRVLFGLIYQTPGLEDCPDAYVAQLYGWAELTQLERSSS